LLRVLYSYIGKYAPSPPPLLGYQPRYLKEIDYMRREKERKGERKRKKNMMDAKRKEMQGPKYPLQCAFVFSYVKLILQAKLKT
jgi:hypothetical protein